MALPKGKRGTKKEPEEEIRNHVCIQPTDAKLK
jgi:hypothetical protein